MNAFTQFARNHEGSSAVGPALPSRVALTNAEEKRASLETEDTRHDRALDVGARPRGPS